MGEAKQRKDKDPNYGKPAPLKLPESRGLIITAPAQISSLSTLVVSSGLVPQELRFALMFWDELAWPTGWVHMDGGADETFLQQAGILTRPNTNPQGDMGESLLKGQLNAFTQLNEISPGGWAIARNNNSLMLMNETSPTKEDILIQLQRAIPIPRKDVALADILEFKERRKPELLSFRSHLDMLTTEIESSLDNPATMADKIKEIDKACSDLITVGKEYQIPFYLSDFKAALKFRPTLVGAVLEAWEKGATYGLEAATLAATGAGVLSMVSVSANKGLRSFKRPSGPYKYAYHLNNEII